MRVPLCLLILTPLLAGAGSVPVSTTPVGSQPSPVAKDCPIPSVILVDRPGQPAKPERLGELPPGTLMLAVDRRVGGCLEPAVMARGIGTGGRILPGR